MFLPLNAVLGSHRNIDTVMFGVKHTCTLERSSPDKYIELHAAAAAGKFHIEHLSVWMPKVRPSVSVQTDLEGRLGQALSVFSTLSKSECTEISLEPSN